MTAAELKTLRESMGLPIRWLALATGVKERTVNYWESGKNQVPTDAEAIILRVKNIFIEALKNALVAVGETGAKQEQTPQTVVFLRYCTELDLYAAHPEFKTLGLPVTFHAALIAAIARALEGQGQKTAIVYFDQASYNAWLTKKGITDNAGQRRAWSVLQAESD